MLAICWNLLSKSGDFRIFFLEIWQFWTNFSKNNNCKNCILFFWSPSGEVLPQIKTLIVVQTHTYHHFYVIHQIGINICIIWMCDLMQHV